MADKSERTAQEMNMTTTTTHNASPQIDVVRNHDHALDFSHEHQHSHLHHSDRAVHDEGVSYTKGTTDEPPVIPKPDVMDNALHRRHIGGDYEKGGLNFQDSETGEASATASEEDPRNHRMSHLYRRFRPFVHLFIFLLFTG